MAVTVTKEVKIEIDGDDVEALKTVCEWARHYLDSNRTEEEFRNYNAAQKARGVIVRVEAWAD